jgi:hypothetical protein
MRKILVDLVVNILVITIHTARRINLKNSRSTMSQIIGTINYYQGWDSIKTDVILNQCKTKIKEEEEEEVDQEIPTKIMKRAC